MTVAARRADPGAALWLTATTAAGLAWLAVYRRLAPFSAWLVARLPIAPGSRLAEAVAFFVYDTPKARAG